MGLSRYSHRPSRWEISAPVRAGNRADPLVTGNTSVFGHLTQFRARLRTATVLLELSTLTPWLDGRFSDVSAVRRAIAHLA